MWDAIDAVLLDAIRRGTLAAVTDYPPDVVKSLVCGYLDAGYIMQTVPGCDRYELTLMGRARLLALTTHRTLTDTTRKAA